MDRQLHWNEPRKIIQIRNTGDPPQWIYCKTIFPNSVDPWYRDTSDPGVLYSVQSGNSLKCYNY